MSRMLIIAASLAFFSCKNEKDSKAPNSDQIQLKASRDDTTPRIKFKIPIDYSKYRADIIAGRIRGVNFSSNSTAKRFRSAIQNSIDKFGVNFGGHYNLSRWGCGTSCISGAITDLNTGNVYDIPTAALNYEFKKDSRLLVINPPDSNGYYDFCGYCTPELWIWNESNKKFEAVK